MEFHPIGEPAFFHNAPVYWGKAFNFVPKFQYGDEPPVMSSHMKVVYLDNRQKAHIVICILNSSLFYWFNWQYTNCRDLSTNAVEAFPCSLSEMDYATQERLANLCLLLMTDYRKNSKIYRRESKGVITKFDSFYPALSKPIIDEIDKVLAKHYGFTDEELDFIINYDIKYRMGDELNADEDE